MPHRNHISTHEQHTQGLHRLGGTRAIFTPLSFLDFHGILSQLDGRIGLALTLMQVLHFLHKVKPSASISIEFSVCSQSTISYNSDLIHESYLFFGRHVN
jgi:hypothetical protein